MNAVTQLAVSVQGFLADGGNSPSDVNQTTGKGPEWGEAAPVGLLVIVLLCVAVYFLVKSLNRNIRKVPESFSTVGTPGAEADGPRTEPSTTGADADPAPPAGSS
ncbi:hypothetical protein SAMN04515671_0483 [Nakamurella panacisegetis]|uniref:Uncharacterized protein n=1 Tax=Nakamurella panacisegetis TaxID=1090615 RepID=A0A1H0IFH6_9ACTN|nr:hypothetical protein [Nakamurella panacisegetis]SDO30096.1 hypothetical protein SAMN04515671_0483 [Nakamurella panacisegetis]